MAVYFGKMKSPDQCRSFICSGGVGNQQYFGGMQPGDYAFIRLKGEDTPEGRYGSHTHRLWRLTSIDYDQTNHSVAHFDEIFTFNSILLSDFSRLNLFKLTKGSVVLVSRQVKSVGFIKLELTDEALFNNLISDRNTFNAYISNKDNYRNPVYLKETNGVAPSNKDIQIFKDTDGLFKIYNNRESFIQGFVAEFNPNKCAELADLVANNNLSANRLNSQRKALKWLNNEGNGEIRLLSLWDLFCSKQKWTVEPTPEEEEELKDEDEDEERQELNVSDNNDLPRNLILYGPPGTGKTYSSIIRAVAIVENAPLKQIEQENYSDVLLRFKDYKNQKRIGFITFHQSYSYEDFIEGIKPVFEINDLRYQIKSGVFKEFCNSAGKEGNYCFIIDEVNRGNVSKIFGELITLIEPEKRLGAKEAMSCKLLYSNEDFGVPSNVYIIGTMNTADRSLVQLDAALRRRFEFEEMMPDYELLRNIKVGNIEIDKMLKAMNDRICVLLDREHQIGHSYLLPLKDNMSLNKLNYIFKNKIIPLLQEYFYEDYNLIKKVLADENDFVIENQSAYLYNIKKESESNYKIPPIERFPSEEAPYIRIYNELAEDEEN